MFNTYSFEDVTCSLNHSAVGAASTTGAGMGSITVSMAGDRTAHDIAADGTVMISKLANKNGTIALAIQQTSELNKYLLRWYNYIDSAKASEWAGMNITIKSNNLGDITTCTGVSPQKLADRPYQAQGQQITWTLMCAEITQS